MDPRPNIQEVLLRPSAELRVLYERNGTFRMMLDNFAQMLPAMVQGLALEAKITDQRVKVLADQLLTPTQPLLRFRDWIQFLSSVDRENHCLRKHPHGSHKHIRNRQSVHCVGTPDFVARERGDESDTNDPEGDAT